MQYILAPSKTMTVQFALPQGIEPTLPHFLNRAKNIASTIKQLSHLDAHMNISPTLANNVQQMYRIWNSKASPAILAYRGDVYKGFYADTLTNNDLLWAQKHLFIMSGLYGALRPLDVISPYRLEMKAKISVGNYKDIYDFWGDTIAKYIDTVSDDIIVNLCSDEYAKVVTKFTRKTVITPVFLDNKTNGKLGTVPIYSKMMRGVLARWAIDHRVETTEQLKDFSTQGYNFSIEHSTKSAPAFYRETPAPIQF